MDSFDILVIILSVALSISLIISIAVGVLVYKLVQELRQIAAQAEHVASNIADASDFVKNSAGPMAYAKILGNFIGAVVNNKSKKK